MAKRMKIDLHCQQQNWCTLKVLFNKCIDCVDTAGHSSARVCHGLTFVLARLCCRN